MEPSTTNIVVNVISSKSQRDIYVHSLVISFENSLAGFMYRVRFIFVTGCNSQQHSLYPLTLVKFCS